MPTRSTSDRSSRFPQLRPGPRSSYIQLGTADSERALPPFFVSHQSSKLIPQQHELKDTPQTSPLPRISPTTGDSESGEDNESNPKFGTFPPQGYHQPADAMSLSPPSGEVGGDDEFFTHFGPDPDERLVEDQDNTRFFGKSSLFAFANRAFDEKEHMHDPLRSMQTHRTEFWDLPDVFHVHICVLFSTNTSFSGSLPYSSPRQYGSNSQKGVSCSTSWTATSTT